MFLLWACGHPPHSSVAGWLSAPPKKGSPAPPQSQRRLLARSVEGGAGSDAPEETLLRGRSGGEAAELLRTPSLCFSSSRLRLSRSSDSQAEWEYPRRASGCERRPLPELTRCVRGRHPGHGAPAKRTESPERGGEPPRSRLQTGQRPRFG
uniref:Uncharacterized protein n=1 Tax=Rangifer tarandus platyrhynchus TaxID=3082113 RepID=A0ACB0F887_RANTA|nr:unnamed protein product [Rangifer tarandus platyrhynchus]